jgi:subtilase family serine protease
MWHQWLTPEQFANAYGPSGSEIAQVRSWLISQGFTIDDEARGGMTLNFSADVETVEQAFRTSIMNYRVQGQLYHANATDPSIPAELGDLVNGVVSLHNIPQKAKHTGVRRLTPGELARIPGANPIYTSGSGNHYLTPGDFATIYNATPLYNAGIDGSGVKIAIVGRTLPTNALVNWNQFRTDMGLPANPPTIIVNGNPGDQGAGDDFEADLDVEWSGAVAPKASIQYVCSASTGSTQGIDLSAQYIVNNNVAPIMSSSYGLCESEMGANETAFINALWQQAAAQGITVFVAAGDSGASDCYDPPTVTSLATDVDGAASTPYNVSVGGTMFNDNGTGTTYWTAFAGGGTPPPFPASARGYIPEVVWNENDLGTSGTSAGATGGGAANQLNAVYSRPAWQVAPGVTGSYRQVPDVALASAGHDGYLIRTDDSGNGLNQYFVGGGTSCAAPTFAALMALVEQKNGQLQGNANVVLYQLGNAQYSYGTPVVFHDIKAGNNQLQVSGAPAGYSAGTGYDECTGLGSVDATALADNWSSAIITINANEVGIITGSLSPVFAPVASGTSGTVTWTASGGLITVVSPTSAAFSAATVGTYTLTATVSGQVQKVIYTINVSNGNFMEVAAGEPTLPPTLLDVLDLAGHFGLQLPAFALDGTGTVDQDDFTILLTKLGW